MKFALVLLALILFSCGIHERKYRKGFFVERIHPTLPNQLIVSQKNDSFRKNTISCSTNNAMIAGVEKANYPLTLQQFKAWQVTPDSCDIVFFKDGTQLEVKISAINFDEVKYKRCDNPNGQAFVSPKSDLIKIQFANGRLQVFDEQTPPPQEEVKKEEVIPKVEVTPKKNDDTLIKKAVISPKVIPMKEIPNKLGILSWISGITAEASLGMQLLLILIGIGVTATAAELVVVLIVLFGFISLVASVVGTISGARALKQIELDPDLYTADSISKAKKGFRLSLKMLILWALSLLLVLLGL